MAQEIIALEVNVGFGQSTKSAEDYLKLQAKIKQEILDLRNVNRDLNKQLKDVNKDSTKSLAERRKLRQQLVEQIVKNESELKKLAKTLKETNKEAKLVDDAVTAYEKANIELSLLRKKIREIRAEGGIVDAKDLERIQELETSLKQASSTQTIGAFQELKNELRELQTSIRDTKALGGVVDEADLKRVDELNQLIKEANRTNPASPYQDLNDELSQLRKKVRDIKALGGVVDEKDTQRIDELDKKLKSIDADLGIYTRNVGNYSNSIKEAFEGASVSLDKGLGGVLEVAIGTFGGVAGAAALEFAVNATQQYGELTKEIIDFRGQLQKLTQVEGEQLNQVTANGLAVARTFELANDEVGKGISQIQQQLGVGAEEASNFLEQTLLAAADPSDALGRVNDELKQLTDLDLPPESILSLLVESSNRNINVDLLAEPIIKMREATPATVEALEAAFGAQGADEIFKEFEKRPLDAIKRISDKIDELPPRSKEAGLLLADIFGSAGEDAVQSARNIGQLKTTLDELIDTRNEQTQSQLRTLEVEREFALVQQELVAALGDTSATFKELGTQTLTVVLKGLVQLIEIAKALPSFLSENKVQIIALGTGILALNANNIAVAASTLKVQAAQTIATAATKAQVIAQRALNIVMKANPIGLVVTAIGLLIAGFKTAYDRSETFRASIAGLGALASEVFAIVKEAIGGFVSGFNKLKDGDFKGAFKDIGKAVIDSNPIKIAFTEGERLKNAYIQGYDSKKASEAVDKEQEKLKSGLEKLSTLSNVANQVGQDIGNGFDTGLNATFTKTTKSLKDKKEKLERELETTEIGSARFKEIKSDIQAIDKELESVFDKANKNANILASSSLSFLKKQLSDLRQELEKAPNTEVAKQKIREIFEVENEVEKAQKLLDDYKTELEGLEQRKGFSVLEALPNSRTNLGLNAEVQSEETGTNNLSERLAAIEIEKQARILAATEAAKTEEELSKATKLIELETTKKIAQAKLSVEENTAQEKLELVNQVAKAELDIEKEKNAKKIALRKQINDALLNATKQVVDLVFSIEQNNLNRQKKRELEDIETKYDRQIKAAEGNAEEIARIEKEKDKEIKKVEKEAFERQKRFSITQALINGALAVTKILAEVPKFDFGISTGILIAAAAVTTAAQVAAISAQQFAKGTVLRGDRHGAKGSMGIPMFSRTGQMFGYAEDGEAITTRATTQNAKSRGLLGWFNQLHGGTNFGGLQPPKHIQSMISDWLGLGRIVSKLPARQIFSSGTVLSQADAQKAASSQFFVNNTNTFITKAEMKEVMFEVLSQLPPPVLNLQQLTNETDRLVQLKQNSVVT